ncbi:MAG TPA: acyl-CoA dehydrogenase family protein [Pyrinomonadaceae bacterium]|nr:acyl-CoA dehydrogenase family protein [Pyrinomonadaceae bacterium]
MKIELTPEQEKDRAEFRAFVVAEIIPHAGRFDREGCVPRELISKIAARGYLGALLPRTDAEKSMDVISFGLLNEEFGRGCSSLRSLLTVHNMVAHAVLRWGSKTQKEHWLSRLRTGEAIAAFCLTEPGTGSDAKSIETTATLSGDVYLLNGRKKWITFGQIADLFLVFAQCEGKAAAFLVEKESPGLSIKPIEGMLGLRASMLAELQLNDCRVPKENLLSRAGFGFSHVAASALDYGRYSVAWGCVGIAQACVDASLSYAEERKQFGARLKDHQLIRRLLTNMITNLKAARLLCLQAGYLKEIGDPRSIMETSIAKYFASTTASQAANDAVQIHGANGCSGDFPVERFLRDARIMEIIEGSTQMQQLTIAEYGYQEYRA